MSNSFDKIMSSIGELKRLGKVLIPYNYPKNSSEDQDDDLLIFKSRKFLVDGYSVVGHYQRCNYDEYFMDVLQLYGDYSTFLPINVNCKLAKMFLGDKEISLIETYKEMKKIYCWAVYLDMEENVLPCPVRKKGEMTFRTHGGLRYSYIPPSSVYFI